MFSEGVQEHLNTIENTELIKVIKLVFCCNIIGGRQNGLRSKKKTNTNKLTN